MVTKRKVTKKKTAKKSVSSKSTATVAKRASSSARKKKGVAAKRKPASATFVIGDSMVISDVMEWHGKMLEAISNHDEIILDGGGIEHIDGTGLQLLVALMKEAAVSNTMVAWKSTSDVLCSNAAQLGLTAILCLDGQPESK